MDVVERRELHVVPAARRSLAASRRELSASSEGWTWVCDRDLHCRAAGRARGRDLSIAHGAAGRHMDPLGRLRVAGSTVRQK